MPSSLLYNNFSSGVLSKKMRRQVTAEIYQNSAKKLENVVPLTTGGFSIRPGFKQLVEITGFTRIIPFVISSTEYYLVLIGTENIRICSFNAFDQLVETSYIFDSPYNSAADIEEICYTQDYQRLIMTQINTAPQVLEKLDLGFRLAPLSLITRTQQESESEDGTITYVDYDYNGLFTQPGKYPAVCAFATGRLWFASTLEEPYRLYASRPNVYNNFIPYDYYEIVDNKTTTEQYLESYNASGTSVTYYNNDIVVATEEDANKKVETTISVSNEGYKYTTKTYYTKGESTGDQEIVWNFEKTENTVEKYTEAKTIWEGITTDDCSMHLDPASDRNDRIAWIASATLTFYGTMSNIYLMDADISPTNTKNEATGAYGSGERIQPARGNSFIYYVVAGKKQIRTVRYGYYGTEFGIVSQYADDLFEAGIKRIVWQSVPEPRLFVLLNDGTLAVMVDAGNTSVSAWCHWSVKNCQILDIAVLDTENGQDVYCLIQNGNYYNIQVLKEGVFKDGSTPIECDVVLNAINGGATITNYKSAGVYYVDSLGTKFCIGQEGERLLQPAVVDDLLTRVSAPNRPSSNFCIEMKNVENEDFKILCVATSVEVQG